MLEFKALPFYTATMTIRDLLARINAQGLTSARQEENGGTTVAPISDRVFLARLGQQCEDLESACQTLGARVTHTAVAELQAELNSEEPFITFASLIQIIKEIDITLRRELGLVTLLSLEPKERDLYEPAEPLFGTEFQDKFSLALFDLDEAAKCLALNRLTASAFHLMRLTELGLKAIAACLGATLPIGGAARNWGEVLRAIKASMDAKSAARGWAANDKEFFESSYASLDAIRVAWRNPTMHVETKYTLTEAEHVLVAVKGFMTRLASRCDENGEPKA